MLYEVTQQGRWSAAIKICRFVKEPTLWACLAGMALQAREFDTVEIALAALEQIDKVQYINHIKELPSTAAKNAEICL